MDYLQLIETMPAQIYQSLVRSVETGRWPDGKILTIEQRANAMQAIIAWGVRHLAEEDRIGHIEKHARTDDHCDRPPELPLIWKE